jgi:hypothetical protein
VLGCSGAGSVLTPYKEKECCSVVATSGQDVANLLTIPLPAREPILFPKGNQTDEQVENIPNNHTNQMGNHDRPKQQSCGTRGGVSLFLAFARGSPKAMVIGQTLSRNTQHHLVKVMARWTLIS